MGTPEFAVPSLNNLIKAGHEIIAVFTQPDRPVGRKQVITPSPVKVFATENKLPIHQPTKIRNEEARSLFEPLFKQADAGVVAAYGRILPEWMLNAPLHGFVNVHSSLLPKYRGAAPINWAIAQGERETGVTIMKMDAGMDTGPILMRRATAIGDEETAAELTPRLAELGAESLIETLNGIERGEIKTQPQNDAEATLAPILKREDGEVDWTMTAREIYNRLRGFTPFPGCYTFFNGRRLEIVKARAEGNEAGENKYQPGDVCEAPRESLVVACGKGTVIQVIEVQLEGKRVMPARDFLNGANLKAGTRLGARGPVS